MTVVGVIYSLTGAILWQDGERTILYCSVGMPSLSAEFRLALQTVVPFLWAPHPWVSSAIAPPWIIPQRCLAVIQLGHSDTSAVLLSCLSRTGRLKGYSPVTILIFLASRKTYKHQAPACLTVRQRRSAVTCVGVSPSASLRGMWEAFRERADKPPTRSDVRSKIRTNWVLLTEKQTRLEQIRNLPLGNVTNWQKKPTQYDNGKTN